MNKGDTMQAKYKINNYDNLITYTEIVDAGYWKEELMIERLNKQDAINDAINEIELLESISKYPDSQF